MIRTLDRSSTVFAVFALALAVSACGDDGPTPPASDQLQEAEIEEMALALASLGALSATPGAAPTDSAVACPLGGNVRFSGDISPDPADQRVLRMDITMVPQGCALPFAGSLFSLDGNPGVRQAGTATLTGFLQPILLDFDVTGGVNWRVASSARSGTCFLDLDLDGRIEWPTTTSADTVPTLHGNLAGAFCETQINLSLPGSGGGG